jgi:hypothetical protein
VRNLFPELKVQLKAILRKAKFLLVIPLILGLSVYSFLFIVCHFFDLTDSNNIFDRLGAFFAVLVPVLLMLSISHYYKGQKGYTCHDFLFLSSGAVFLLFAADLFVSSFLDKSLLVFLFQRVAFFGNNPHNLSDFYSATAQCLAAVFAIVFSLTFVCAQLYSSLYESAQARLIFNKPSTFVLVCAYIFFISYNLCLLGHIISYSEEGVLFGFLGSLFCFFWLFPYIMSVAAELNPGLITKITLSEAREGNDDEKMEAANRVFSNMEYWLQNSKMNEFTVAWLELQDFLKEIEKKNSSKAFNCLRDRIEYFHKLYVEQDSRLGLTVMRRLTERVQELSNGKKKYKKWEKALSEMKKRVLGGLDYYKDYILTVDDLTATECQLMTKMVNEIVNTARDIFLETPSQVPTPNPSQVPKDVRLYIAETFEEISRLYQCFGRSQDAEKCAEIARKIRDSLVKKDSDVNR